ncbi:MAG: Histidine kinase [Bacteroidetes bacterium]|nr:MAG: Histidine kinase [Bacteroidota bacterium]
MTQVRNQNGLSDLSASIVRYILQEIPPYIGLVILHTDENGNILNWFGPLDKYFENSPAKGMPISEFTDILIGMVPPVINPMVISHVRVSEEIYVEIHILNDETNHNWVFIVDQTRQVEIIHPIIQLYNEEKLSKVTDQKQSNARGTLSALYLLDYLSFEKTLNGYRLLGTTPNWFKSLRNSLVYNGKYIDLTETFPYIEVFQVEVDELWNSKEDGKKVSGIWEESKNLSEKIYLQALALRHEERNYLLIKPLNKETDLNDGFIQKAREQKLTLDQLASTEKKLKQLLGFKDQFVSIISHDLRSPIGAVIGLADLLLSDNEMISKISPSQFELMADIKSEMLRLLDYNDKLFQWSNLELGNYKITKNLIIPQRLITYIEKMQAMKLKQKQIELKTKIDPEFKMEGDETLIGQALNNLVGNSVKFTPENGVIALEFKTTGNSHKIQVKDTGIGINRETIDKLFTEFTRKTTVGTYGEKGTGLGLGIVKKILDVHGFSIHVQSEPGEGSTFTIDLTDVKSTE